MAPRLTCGEVHREERAVAGLGEADLHQVVIQLRLDVLPGQQLLAPVGELLGAGHRGVAGAQFLGARGEHHRLEVPADEDAGPVPVADRLLPNITTNDAGPNG
ncbi:hypothetical protein [Streptomyces diacarni]|uniref:hypothetical protein n=1 Tax=Streptomyces diacarni TaxID=2800381 RepID=UPI0015F0C2F6|nr:hypothetical protein [Streptomyces diacarni]